MNKNYCKIEHKWCKYNKKSHCTYCGKELAEVTRCPRLAEIETVRFYELLKSVKFEDVFASITKWFKNQENSIEGYRKVFNTLLGMTPKKHSLTDLFINIDKVVEQDDEWLNVSGYTFDMKKHYSIEFESWINWVSMFVTQETLDSLTVEEIVGASLWEMTYWGFDESKVVENYGKILESVAECMDKK